jgi:hypothetical protein
MAPIDVLSPLSRNTLNANKAAFVALARHLKQTDGEQHTVLLIQLENESGNVGSVRDNSSNRTASLLDRSLLIYSRPLINNPERGVKFLVAKRTKSFSSTIRQSTSMKSPLQAKPNFRFLITLTSARLSGP